MNLVATLFAARNPVPFREIVGKVVGYDDPAGEEALEKRFDRDKAELRRLGVPIEYVAGDGGRRAGYMIPPEKVFQQKVEFTPEDATLLSIAGRIGASATGGGPLEEALKGALRKLATDLPGVSDGFDGLESLTVLRSRPGDSRTAENLAVLGDAISRQVPVEFSYLGLHDRESSRREVHPYGLGLASGRWYLVGHCQKRQSLRVFRVARLVGRVRLNDAEAGAFEVPDDFRVDEYLGRDAWEFGGSEPTEVRLEIAKDFLTPGLLPGARILEETERVVRIGLEAKRPLALVPWILSNGGRVKALSPVELRERVRQVAREMLEAQDTSPPGGAEESMS